MNRICFGAFLAAIAALVPSLSAQEARIQTGREVRVTAGEDGSVHQGRLVLVSGDTLVLDRAGREEWVAVDSLDRVEAARKVRSYTILGAIAGAGVGAALGSTATLHKCQNQVAQGDWVPKNCGIGPTKGALVFGALGLAAGAYIGLHIRTIAWEPIPGVPPGSIRLSVAPLAEGGMAFGVGLAF